MKGLNAPTKRRRLAEWIQKQTHVYAVDKRPTSDLGKHIRLKVRWKKVFHVNGNQKKAGVAILISDKIDFKNKDCYKRKRKKGRRDGKEYVMSETYFEIHQKVVEWMDKEMNRWIAV